MPSWRSAALLSLVACACARAQPVTQAVQCSSNYLKAVPCQLTDQVGGDGVHTMEFTAGDRRTRFVGRSQTGWWSGQLDGQPAMGFERNRGHVVFSTTDLKTTFEWWSAGSEHGSY